MNIMNPYQTMYNQTQPNGYLGYQRPQTNGITWVQGIEGAKAFQIMPNSNTILLDSENDGIFYIKVSDNVGMCNLRTFKYEEIGEQPKSLAPVNLDNYVTRDELTKIINDLKGAMTNGKQSIQSTKQKSIISE